MKVVIDTNILLVSISRRSPFNWIFQQLISGKYLVTQDKDFDVLQDLKFPKIEIITAEEFKSILGV